MTTLLKRESSLAIVGQSMRMGKVSVIEVQVCWTRQSLQLRVVSNDAFCSRIESLKTLQDLALKGSTRLALRPQKVSGFVARVRIRSRKVGINVEEWRWLSTAAGFRKLQKISKFGLIFKILITRDKTEEE